MVELRKIQPKDPPLTLAEAKEILALAVLEMDHDKSLEHNEDYRDSMISIKNAAAEFLRENIAVNNEKRVKEVEAGKKCVNFEEMKAGRKCVKEVNAGKKCVKEVKAGRRCVKEVKAGKKCVKDAKAGKKCVKEAIPPPKEILVPLNEQPGPCPCVGCKNNSHIPGLELRHQCPFCSKSYYKTSHLRSHMHVHSATRGHVCSECGDSFKRHDQLVRHLYTHDTGKHRFKCKTCSTIFTRKDNYKLHIKRKQACRVALGDSNDVYSGLEEIDQHSDIKKQKRPKKDAAAISSELNSRKTSGEDTILIPVHQNTDGTLTINGDIISVPPEEAAELLAKSRDSSRVTSRCSTEECPGGEGEEGGYQSAATPPDIMSLNVNLPITDQVAQLSGDYEVFFKTEEVYGGDVSDHIPDKMSGMFGMTAVNQTVTQPEVMEQILQSQDINHVETNGLSGESQPKQQAPVVSEHVMQSSCSQMSSGRPQVSELSSQLQESDQHSTESGLSTQRQPPDNSHTVDSIQTDCVLSDPAETPTLVTPSPETESLVPAAQIPEIYTEDQRTSGDCAKIEERVQDSSAQDAERAAPDNTASGSVTATEESDILSQVIADILTDTLPDTGAADEQIINVMQGEVTVTSSSQSSSTTTCAMELLEAVLLMRRTVSDTMCQDVPVDSSALCQVLQPMHEIAGQSVEIAVTEQHNPPITAGSMSVETENRIVPHNATEESSLKSKKPKSIKPKTPRSGKKRRTDCVSESPEKKVLKIKNSVKPKDTSFVKQIFTARKRLFEEEEGDIEQENGNKSVKLEEQVLTVGASNGNLVEQSNLLLQKNEMLLAEAMGRPDSPEEEKTGPEEEDEERQQSPVDCGGDIFLSPYRDALFSDSPPVGNTLLSSSLTSSPLLHDSPKFLFLASSPARSQTPDRTSIRSGTPEPSLFNRCVTPDRGSLFHNIGRESPLFHRSPDTRMMRSPGRGILDTPDHSKLGALSFGHEEPALDDNFICNLDQLLAFK